MATLRVRGEGRVGALLVFFLFCCCCKTKEPLRILRIARFCDRGRRSGTGLRKRWFFEELCSFDRYIMSSKSSWTRNSFDREKIPWFRKVMIKTSFWLFFKKEISIHAWHDALIYWGRQSILLHPLLMSKELKCIKLCEIWAPPPFLQRLIQAFAGFGAPQGNENHRFFVDFQRHMEREHSRKACMSFCRKGAVKSSIASRM